MVLRTDAKNSTVTPFLFFLTLSLPTTGRFKDDNMFVYITFRKLVLETFIFRSYDWSRLGLHVQRHASSMHFISQKNISEEDFDNLFFARLVSIVDSTTFCPLLCNTGKSVNDGFTCSTVLFQVCSILS